MDLFSNSYRLEQVPLPGAEIYYQSHFDLGLSPTDLLEHLIDSVPWRQEDVKVWGKTFKQPRLVAWYGDEGMSYRYSGIYLDPLPWTDTLFRLKHRIQTASNCYFNSVL